MNMLNQPGRAALAMERLRRCAHPVRTASIRYATALGSIVALALLCMLSIRVNSAPAAGAASAAQFGVDPRAVAVLVVLMGIAFGGWCRARAALQHAVEALRGVESEWKRRYAAVEAREHAAYRVADTRATAAMQEGDRLLTVMRHSVVGPLAALTGLVEALDPAATSSAQRTLIGKVQSAARTCLRALEDLLAPPPARLHTIVLDESLIDLRELIEGVVSLISPAATQKGLHLSVSIDQSVAARIVADSARLGDIVFHLLSHAVQSTEHGEITVAVRAEPLKAGSQRILISVRDIGAQAAPMIQPQFPWPFVPGILVDESHNDGGSSFALCQRLARHMRGELTVGQEPGFGTCSVFSVPLATEHFHSPVETAGLDCETPQAAVATRLATSPMSASSEPFDSNYLDALSKEGIHLPTFLLSWRQSMGDDLERLRGLRARHDVDGLRASLHRLSGAVGLVGARSLMEALWRASLIQPEPEAGIVDALAQRSETLVMQLEDAIDPHRSNLP
jgi:signal transduction histidine kinase